MHAHYTKSILAFLNPKSRAKHIEDCIHTTQLLGKPLMASFNGNESTVTPILFINIYPQYSHALAKNNSRLVQQGKEFEKNHSPMHTMNISN